MLSSLKERRVERRDSAIKSNLGSGRQLDKLPLSLWEPSRSHKIKPFPGEKNL
jgi:hypothetical protein